MSAPGLVRSSTVFCRAAASSSWARLGLHGSDLRFEEDVEPRDESVRSATESVTQLDRILSSKASARILFLYSQELGVNRKATLPGALAARPSCKLQLVGLPVWPIRTCIQTQSSCRLWQQTGARSLSTNADVDVREKVDSINSKFAEAREEIEMAMEAKETVFFNEEALAAKKVVEDVLGEYSSLLSQVDEKKRGEIQRSMGLKMEQLKAEAAQLDDASS